MPLPLHFFLPSEAEPAQSLGRANVPEHWFQHRHGVTVDRFPLLAIHPVFHPLVVGRTAFCAHSVGHLSSLAF